ncbi:MAG: ArsR family transcriptional regulator [Calditrichaeota bacterium]|nr:MAG: ArsR family transcriptional regulator [Calditrichota bacterium]
MRSLLKVFKALSDANRLRILKMLEIRPLCVCEITEVLQLAASTVSRHLSVLREAGLILDEKEGKWVNYSLNTSIDGSHPSQILLHLDEWLPDDETIRKDAEKVKSIDRHMICAQ